MTGSAEDSGRRFPKREGSWRERLRRQRGANINNWPVLDPAVPSLRGVAFEGGAKGSIKVLLISVNPESLRERGFRAGGGGSFGLEKLTEGAITSLALPKDGDSSRKMKF